MRFSNMLGNNMSTWTFVWTVMAYKMLQKSNNNHLKITFSVFMIMKWKFCSQGFWITLLGSWTAVLCLTTSCFRAAANEHRSHVYGRTFSCIARMCRVNCCFIAHSYVQWGHYSVWKKIIQKWLFDHLILHLKGNI